MTTPERSPEDEGPATVDAARLDAGVGEHLGAALAHATDPWTRFHLRQAMQLLHADET